MSAIVTNDEFQIIKDRRTEHLYTIEFQSYSESIIKSLIKTRIITGATVSSNYKTLRFKAFSIQTFEQFQEEQQKINGNKKLRISVAAKLLSNLANQLQYLITTQNESFIGYSVKNIIVIDKSKFAYISNEMLAAIEAEKVLMSFPFSPNDFFMSYEQTKITELPFHIHYKTSYYSLACLIIYSLSPDDDFLTDENPKLLCEKLKNRLEILSIKDTKMYCLLKRCLVEDPIERNILFI